MDLRRGDKSPTNDVLDDITLYWLTNTAASSGRLPGAGAGSVIVAAAQSRGDRAASGHAVFPGRLSPRNMGPARYPNLIYFTGRQGRAFRRMGSPSSLRRTPYRLQVTSASRLITARLTRRAVVLNVPSTQRGFSEASTSVNADRLGI
jgi:hypothetical protein